MNAKIAELKSSIKAAALSLKQLNNQIREDQRAGKYAGKLQRQARSDAWICRHMLIAYGLLRGLEYAQIERPAETNPPDWKWIEAYKNACNEPVEVQA